MKTPRSVGLAYDFIEKIHLAAMGEFPDITCAFYDGNFNKTMRQAQKDKHEWILQGLGFKPEDRVLDVGGGWGPMLRKIKLRGGSGVGLTVSQKQAIYCNSNGLDARLQDWKDSDLITLGKFDHVISLGALEHFCSPQEYEEVRQEQIYQDFFKFCHNAIKDNGKLFLQTMLWGDKVFKPSELRKATTKDSHSQIISTLISLSSWWPPTSKEQLINTAKPYFNLLESNNGRRDYAKTFEEWYKLLEKAQRGNFRLKFDTLKQYATNSEFRKMYCVWKESYDGKYFMKAFSERILDHERMFFVRK